MKSNQNKEHIHKRHDVIVWLRGTEGMKSDSKRMSDHIKNNVWNFRWIAKTIFSIDCFINVQAFEYIYIFFWFFGVLSFLSLFRSLFLFHCLGFGSIFSNAWKNWKNFYIAKTFDMLSIRKNWCHSNWMMKSWNLCHPLWQKKRRREGRVRGDGGWSRNANCAVCILCNDLSERNRSIWMASKCHCQKWFLCDSFVFFLFSVDVGICMCCDWKAKSDEGSSFKTTSLVIIIISSLHYVQAPQNTIHFTLVVVVHHFYHIFILILCKFLQRIRSRWCETLCGVVNFCIRLLHWNIWKS